MFETIVVIAVVGLAAAWSLHRFLRTARGVRAGCGCPGAECSDRDPTCASGGGSPLVTLDPTFPAPRSSSEEAPS